MSRCFPFPPPGYEKKARLDDTDLLKKEKGREKKHKKDKEKKEGKEKRDKDRSKEKHREKKDRKEKHKDKDKDKSRTSDEKKVEGQPGYNNGAKVGSNSSQNSEITESLHVDELARRIRVEDKASGSQMVQKAVSTDQRRVEARPMAVERDQKRVEPRGMVLERSIGNKSQEKETVMYKNVGLERSIGNPSQDKKIAKDKNEGNRKVNGQTSHIGTSDMEKQKPLGQNLFVMDRQRVKLVEKKDAEKQTEGKEKNKHKESDGSSDKHNGRDREKHKKSKDRGKDEQKEKTKEITQPSKDQPKIKENVFNLIMGSKDPLDFRNIKSSETIKLTTASPAAETNLGKRKELERNGYLLENENRPNKFPRSVSPHIVADIGKKLEQRQNAVQFGSEKQVLANNLKVDIKEQKLNGLIKPEQKINGLIKAEHKINGTIAPQSRKSPTKSSAGGISANENGETLPKPPHPDTKYLSQILSIPEMEELPDVDDQEWLLGCDQLHSTKPSRSSPSIDEMQQVWAEVIRIESADISALPYVIPY